MKISQFIGMLLAISPATVISLRLESSAARSNLVGRASPIEEGRSPEPEAPHGANFEQAEQADNNFRLDLHEAVAELVVKWATLDPNAQATAAQQKLHGLNFFFVYHKDRLAGNLMTIRFSIGQPVFDGMGYQFASLDDPRKIQRYAKIENGLPPDEIEVVRREGSAAVIDYLHNEVPKENYGESFMNTLDWAMEVYKMSGRELSNLQAAYIRVQMQDVLVQMKDRRQFGRKRDLGNLVQSLNNPNNANSLINQRADFMVCIQIAQSLQSNISNSVIPVLNELVAHSNNVMIYQMALSIYTDITQSPVVFISPYFNGLTAFSSVEYNYATSHNKTISPNGTIEIGPNDTDITAMFRLHAVYEQLYLSTWAKAVQAANSSGQLSDLLTVMGHLIPANQSIAPTNWNDTNVTPPDMGYIQSLISRANVSYVP